MHTQVEVSSDQRTRRAPMSLIGPRYDQKQQREIDVLEKTRNILNCSMAHHTVAFGLYHPLRQTSLCLPTDRYGPARVQMVSLCRSLAQHSGTAHEQILLTIPEIQIEPHEILPS
jgi:hypothetical protein